jgi:hypothetical protein
LPVAAARAVVASFSARSLIVSMYFDADLASKVFDDCRCSS